jgi:transcriptional regulator with XRE-family HTH domain
MTDVPRKEDRERCLNRSIALPALRQLRQSRGLSQRDLGKLAKVSPGTVFRLENSLRGAYPATVQKLASALGTSPAELLVREHRPGREVLRD